MNLFLRLTSLKDFSGPHSINAILPPSFPCVEQTESFHGAVNLSDTICAIWSESTIILPRGAHRSDTRAQTGTDLKIWLIQWLPLSFSDCQGCTLVPLNAERSLQQAKGSRLVGTGFSSLFSHRQSQFPRIWSRMTNWPGTVVKLAGYNNFFCDRSTISFYCFSYDKPRLGCHSRRLIYAAFLHG